MVDLGGLANVIVDGDSGNRGVVTGEFSISLVNATHEEIGGPLNVGNVHGGGKHLQVVLGTKRLDPLGPSGSGDGTVNVGPGFVEAHKPFVVSGAFTNHEGSFDLLHSALRVSLARVVSDLDRGINTTAEVTHDLGKLDFPGQVEHGNEFVSLLGGQIVGVVGVGEKTVIVVPVGLIGEISDHLLTAVPAAETPLGGGGGGEGSGCRLNESLGCCHSMHLSGDVH